ncbi:MAG: gliding motility protein GldN [Solitalea-like symbiont of Acarus siro]
MKNYITLIAFCIVSFSHIQAQENANQVAAPGTPSDAGAAVITPGDNATPRPPVDSANVTNSDKDKNIASSDANKDNQGDAKKGDADPVDEDGVPLNAVFKDENAVNIKIMKYPKIRQADVMYSKRIWREVPFTEKMNKAMGSPKQGIAQVIINAVLNGELTAYANPDDGSDDVFKKKLSIEDVKKLLGGTPEKIQYAPDPNRPDYLVDTVVVNKFDPNSVKKIRLEEDWIIDTKRSLMEPRILAIALLKDIVTQAGETLDGSLPLFWISFKQARKVFANSKVPNKHNDVANITYDGLFVKRLFSSYIVKESNPENLRIVDKTGGQNVKALKESDRISEGLLDKEQDMWSW